jgi:hypothetical protein
MRLLALFPLLLALTTPFAAWSDPVDMTRNVTSRPASIQPVPSLQVKSRMTNPYAIVPDPASLCETAVTTAEYVNRLPPRLLGAISLTETGRIDADSGRIRPWPWTLNAEGEGHYFETPQQAIAAVQKLQARGVRSIDVGCLQINLMYHPNAFASLEEAFDPRGNANYAARFLNALYADGKDWTHAIGAYHSETRALGDAYRVLVMARWQNGDPHAAAAGQAAYRDFAPVDRVRNDQAYGAFAPSSQVYGAFAPR